MSWMRGAVALQFLNGYRALSVGSARRVVDDRE
jgi:hypothetical protein